jgi:predicted dienelactone hydrolase
MKKLFLVLFASSSISLAHAETQMGAVFTETPAAHHTRSIETAIFYPAQGGTEVMIGENAVFYGTPIAKNATPLPGRHPVILLSHGWGGNYKRMGWLSNGLVDRGAIVIAVNHPYSTTGETDDPRALNHWTRAQDLSAALDHALADPVVGPLMDQSRIYAVGFSYGGWTALSLAGVKGSRDGFERFCDDPSQTISPCADILRAGISISALDKAKWDANWKDSRIAAVAAIDPALTWGVKAENLKSLTVPLLLVGLGNDTDRLHATDTSATGSNFESLVPTATVTRIAPAMHFTALGVCKPNGAEILKEEHDDPVCTDPVGTDRARVMTRIIEALANHFGLQKSAS